MRFESRVSPAGAPLVQASMPIPNKFLLNFLVPAVHHLLSPIWMDATTLRDGSVLSQLVSL